MKNKIIAQVKYWNITRAMIRNSKKNSKTQFSNYQLRQCYCFSFTIFTTGTTLYTLSQKLKE